MAKNKQRTYGPEEKGVMERDERGVTSINTGEPDERFPQTKQTLKAEDQIVGKNELSVDAANAVRDVRKRISVRPSSDTKIVEGAYGSDGGAPYSGASPTSARARAVANAAGATNVSYTADMSKKPYTEGNKQSDVRFARKSTLENFDIDNAACQQEDPSYTELKPLSESADKLMGYTGRTRFTVMRGKKNGGRMPGDMMYYRAINEHEHHATVSTCGQVVADSSNVDANGNITGNIEPAADYPTRRALPTTSSDPSGTEQSGAGYEDITSPMHKGNYVLKSFSFKLSKQGISEPKFNEDRLVSSTGYLNLERANFNWQIDQNVCIKATRKLQAYLGRETASDWSSLGLAIDQPYQTENLVHDIEAMTGALCATAERTMTSALAYNSLNKVKLDGNKPTLPAIEMFLGGMFDLAQSIKPTDPIANLKFYERSGADLASIFEPQLYKRGSAALFAFLEDPSVRKYVTKSTFFNFPRTLKNLVQQGENSFKTLRCKPEFIKALNVEDSYSTEDGQYSSALPINTTGFISVVNPMSLNFFLQGWSLSNVSPDNPGGCVPLYAYKYKDLRMWAYKPIIHPLVEGIMDYLVRKTPALIDAFNISGNKEVIIEIPCIYNSKYPTAWSALLCSAASRIVDSRSIRLNDFFYAGDMLKEYLFPDLKSLDELNCKYSDQKRADSYNEPVSLGKMNFPNALRTFWPETYQPMVTDDPTVGASSAVYYAPWFHNETNYGSDYTERGGFFRDDSVATMSMPSIQNGVNHDMIDMLYSVEPRDVRLSLDAPIELPYPSRTDVITSGSYVSKTYCTAAGNSSVYSESDMKTMMTPFAFRTDNLSDGRVGIYYKNLSSNGVAIPTKASVMCIPRELGWLYPRFRVAPIVNSITVTNGDFSFSETSSHKMSAPLSGAMSDRLIAYTVEGQADELKAISMSAALQQNFVSFIAERGNVARQINNAFYDRIGIAPSQSYLHTKLESGVVAAPLKVLNSSTQFISPITNASFSIPTIRRWMYCLMQRMFLPYNVFEVASLDAASADPSADDIFPGKGSEYDPMEACVYFGYCGMLAADYYQDIMQRGMDYQALSVDYINDSWRQASLITR